MGYEVDMGTGGSKPEIIPTGTYRAEVTEASVNLRKSDSEPFACITWSLKDGTGRTVDDVWPLIHPKMGWKSAVYQKAAGLPHEGKYEVEPKKWVGIYADILVAINRYKDEERNQINNVKKVEPEVPGTDKGTPYEEDIPF